MYVRVYICMMHVYVYVYIHTYTNIYTHIDNELNEGEKDDKNKRTEKRSVIGVFDCIGPLENSMLTAEFQFTPVKVSDSAASHGWLVCLLTSE